MKVGLPVALCIAISGQMLYHVTQKSVAVSANPVVSLIAFYGLAAALSLPLFWLFPLRDTVASELGQLNWAVWGVAASIVLAELGFLLAYRAGGSLSSSFVVTAAVVTASLAVIGYFAFKEQLSLEKLAGIALCLSGIWLVSRRPA